MPIKNLASGTLAESVSASTTTLLVYVGEGGAATIRNVWPNTPFYATIMPANPSAGVANSLDSEIVKVTAVGNDQVGNVALTVERAAKGSTAKSFTAGAIVTNGVYMEDILDRFYPVGSIYLSVSSTSPNTLFGGTWVQIEDTFLLTAGSTYTAGDTGGSATHTHSAGTLQADVGNYGGRVYMRKEGTTTFTSSSYIAGTSEGDNAVRPQGTNVSGRTGSASTLPPYLVVYAWKRTA